MDIRENQVNEQIQIGDTVVCVLSGVHGIVVKQYFPTACEEQTMIECPDGRLYHAPTRLFRRCKHGC